jgi:hypothetical protein
LQGILVSGKGKVVSSDFFGTILSNQKNNSTVLSTIYDWFYSVNKSTNYKYYNELNNDFVTSFFVANNFFKQQYYNIDASKNSLWLTRLINNYVKLSVDTNDNIVNGLIMEPLLNNNLNSFLAWENVRHSTKLEIV